MAQTFEQMSFTRNCSYCESATHNIRGCDSSDINVLCEAASMAFETLRRTRTPDETKNIYISWIKNTYNLKQLRVIAVTKMNDMVYGRNKSDYAEKVWYVNNFNYETILEEAEAEAEAEEVEEVSWYIDRNPSIALENMLSLDGFQTPPTMSPRDAPPEIQRHNNAIILNDDDRDPPAFRNIQPMTRNDAAMALLDIRREIMENEGPRDRRERERQGQQFDIIVKTQEFIGLSELLEDNFECPICYENHDKSMKLVLGCNHEFCTECIIKTLKTNNKPRCAFCRDVMKDFTVYNNEEFNKLKTCCRIK